MQVAGALRVAALESCWQFLLELNLRTSVTQQFCAGTYPTKTWAVYSSSTSVLSVPKYVSNTCCARHCPGSWDMSVWRLHSRRGDRHKPEKIKTTDNASRRENAGTGKGGSELQCSAEGNNVRIGGRRAYREDSL